jgi:hypothetical protein
LGADGRSDRPRAPTPAGNVFASSAGAIKPPSRPESRPPGPGRRPPREFAGVSARCLPHPTRPPKRFGKSSRRGPNGVSPRPAPGTSRRAHRRWAGRLRKSWDRRREAVGRGDSRPKRSGTGSGTRPPPGPMRRPVGRCEGPKDVHLRPVGLAAYKQTTGRGHGGLRSSRIAQPATRDASTRNPRLAGKE